MHNVNIFKIAIIGIAVAIGLVAILIFSGKFPGLSTPTGETDTNKPTMLIWGTISSQKFQATLDSYLAAGNPPLRVTYIEKSNDTIINEVVNAGSQGGGPDLIIAPHTTLLSMASLMYVIPYTYMSELDYKNIYIDGADIFTSPYGVSFYPLLADPMIMIYNKKILRDNDFIGPPKKWIELPKYQEKLTKYDSTGKPVQSAFGIGANNVVNIKDILFSQIMQLGIDPIKSFYSTSIDGKPVLAYLINLANSNADDMGSYSPLVSILRFQAAFSDPQKTTFTWSETGIDDLSSFIAGKTAIYFGKASDIDNIRNSNPALDIGLYYLPQTVDDNTQTMNGDIIGVGVGKNTIDFETAVSVSQLLSGTTFSPTLSKVTGMAGARKDVLYGNDGSERSEVVGRSSLVMRLLYDSNRNLTDSFVYKLYDNILSGRKTIVDAANDFEKNIINIYNPQPK